MAHRPQDTPTVVLIPEDELEALFIHLALAAEKKCPAVAYTQLNGKFALDIPRCLRDVWSNTPHPIFGSNPFHPGYKQLTTCQVCRARAVFLQVELPLPLILPAGLQALPKGGLKDEQG